MESRLEKGTRCWFDLNISEKIHPPLLVREARQQIDIDSHAEYFPAKTSQISQQDETLSKDTIPPSAVIADLLESAERGNIKKVGKMLTQLKQEHASYSHFIDKLHRLVENFQVDATVDFLRHLQKEYTDGKHHND